MLLQFDLNLMTKHVQFPISNTFDLCVPAPVKTSVWVKLDQPTKRVSGTFDTEWFVFCTFIGIFFSIQNIKFHWRRLIIRNFSTQHFLSALNSLQHTPFQGLSTCLAIKNGNWFIYCLDRINSRKRHGIVCKKSIKNYGLEATREGDCLIDEDFFGINSENVLLLVSAISFISLWHGMGESVLLSDGTLSYIDNSKYASSEPLMLQWMPLLSPPASSSCSI